MPDFYNLEDDLLKRIQDAAGKPGFNLDESAGGGFSNVGVPGGISYAPSYDLQPPKGGTPPYPIANPSPLLEINKPVRKDVGSGYLPGKTPPPPDILAKMQGDADAIAAGKLAEINNKRYEIGNYLTNTVPNYASQITYQKPNKDTADPYDYTGTEPIPGIRPGTTPIGKGSINFQPPQLSILDLIEIDRIRKGRKQGPAPGPYKPLGFNA